LVRFGFSCAYEMGGARIELEEREADGFSGFGERRESDEEDVPEDFEGSAFDSLDYGLGLGFSQDGAGCPGFV
jgi:hypothetical protein